MPPTEVAIVSAGAHTPSLHFLRQMGDSLDGGDVWMLFKDVRRHMPANANGKDDKVNHSPDCRDQTVQRYVMSMEGFDHCVIDELSEMKRAADSGEAGILVLFCSSSDHRSFVTAETVQEASNALIDDNGQRLFNSMHFPFGSLRHRSNEYTDYLLHRAWEEVMGWVTDPWYVQPSSDSTALSTKYGYDGAKQRREAYFNLQRVWEWVEDRNTVIAEPPRKSQKTDAPTPAPPAFPPPPPAYPIENKATYHQQRHITTCNQIRTTSANIVCVDLYVFRCSRF